MKWSQRRQIRVSACHLRQLHLFLQSKIYRYPASITFCYHKQLITTFEESFIKMFLHICWYIDIWMFYSLNPQWHWPQTSLSWTFKEITCYVMYRTNMYKQIHKKKKIWNKMQFHFSCTLKGTTAFVVLARGWLIQNHLQCLCLSLQRNISTMWLTNVFVKVFGQQRKSMTKKNSNLSGFCYKQNLWEGSICCRFRSFQVFHNKWSVEIVTNSNE